MTVQATARKASYTGNGSAATFAFTWKVFAASDVVVTVVTIATGAEQLLTYPADYSVSINADQNANPGGSVSYLVGGSTPLTNASNLVITSAVPAVQGVDAINAGGFFPEVAEAALDRSIVLIQEAQEILSRAIRVPVSEAGPFQLPPVAQRKGKLLYFDPSTGALSLLDPTAVWQAVWHDWTPAITTDVGTLVDTVIPHGRYSALGKQVHFQCVFSTTVASGAPWLLKLAYPAGMVGASANHNAPDVLLQQNGVWETGWVGETNTDQMSIARVGGAFASAIVGVISTVVEIA